MSILAWRSKSRSLTVVSVVRASLYKYVCQIWILYLLRFKRCSNVKVESRHTELGLDNRQKLQKKDDPFFWSGWTKKKLQRFFSYFPSWPWPLTFTHLTPHWPLTHPKAYRVFKSIAIFVNCSHDLPPLHWPKKSNGFILTFLLAYVPSMMKTCNIG